MTDFPHLLNLLSVAEALSVSPHTVRSWVKKGKLTPVRICRRLLFHPEDITRLVNKARAVAQVNSGTNA